MGHRVLIISPFNPIPENLNGVNKINAQLLENNPHFHADILFLTYNRSVIPKNSVRANDKFIALPVRQVYFPGRNLFRWLFSRYPYNVAKLQSYWESLASKVLELEGRYDVLHLSSPALIPILNFLPDQIRGKIILFPIDSMTLYTERRLVQEKSFIMKLALFHDLRKIRKFEAKYFSGPTQTVFVSTSDCQKVAQLASNANLHYIPNGVDLGYFHQSKYAVLEPHVIIFTGVMSYAPNKTAAMFLIKEVLPLVHKEFANAHLFLIGREPSKELVGLKSKSVTVSGFVEDIRPFMEKAALYVAPLAFGSGIKNKVLEAMAMGKTVLGSPISFEGIEGVENRDFISLDGDAQSWALAILRLLKNPAAHAEIGRNARLLVETQYSWTAVRRRYGEAYARCIDNR